MHLSSLLLKVQKWSKQFSNLPDKYIERSMKQVYWSNPKNIQYRSGITIERKKFRFTMNRSWTGQFRNQNQTGILRKKVFVEPVLNWSFFRGDRVEILEGRDKGKQGIIKQVIQERNWVIIEGLNCHNRRVGANNEFGGIFVKSEAPLLVTKQVKLVDPSDLKGTDIEWRYTDEGEYVRVSSRTGRIIPIPATNSETIDYKSKSTYKEQAKDTNKKEMSTISFQPTLQTFEMEIMSKLGINDQNPMKSYWY